MIQDKPAIVAAVAMISGIVLARFLNFSWIPWAIAAAFFFCLSLFQFFSSFSKDSRRRSSSIVLLAALMFASGAFSILQKSAIVSTDIRRFLDVPDSLTIQCKVVDEPKIKNEKLTALVEILSLSNETDSLPVSGRAYVYITKDRNRDKELPPVLYGSVLTLKSLLQQPPDSRNPGEFSYRKYLELNDIYATIFVYGCSGVKVSVQRETNFFFEKILFPSKNFIVRHIMDVMKGDESFFLIGLLLGDRSDISQEIKKAFMNTGTIHVLAVSGSHVVLVVAVIFTVLGLLRFPRKIKIVLTIFILIYYTYLTGATPSVVRASIMASIILLGKLFEERINVYNVLGISAILILLYDPKQLFDVGFQLSFSAVFSIVYFYPKLNVVIQKIPERLEEFKIVQWLWQAFAVSLAAQIGTIPFTAYYFGKVSLISFAANLLVVPLVGVLVSIGLSGVLVSVVSSFAGSCFFEVNQLIAWFTLKAVRLAESVPHAVLNTSQFGWKETIFYTIIIVFIFNFRNAVIQKRLILVSLIAVNIFFYASIFRNANQNLRVTFLDVGQGDAAVIRFPNDKVLLVDAGPLSSDFDAGERIVAPYLERNGISHIDAILTTHPHADHLGGVPYLLKHFSIGETIDQNQQTSSRLFREYSLLEKRGKQQTMTAGMASEEFADAKLYCFHPSPTFIDVDSADGYSDLNESSIVFKLQYGKTAFLFTGDAETPAEEHMVRIYGDFLKSDVIKVGHHGSITSSSPEFISMVQPHDAVVSVGKFNKFRHPSKVVLARYQDINTAIHRTDEGGAVVFESDGSSVRKTGWKTE